MDDIATPDGGQAQAQEQEPEPEQVAQPPEGMDSDLAYESTKACLESLPEDMSLEQMQYLVLVLQDSLSLVAQRDPDVTAGKAAGYMDRFESQIRTHFAQVIDA